MKKNPTNKFIDIIVNNYNDGYSISIFCEKEDITYEASIIFYYNECDNKIKSKIIYYYTQNTYEGDLVFVTANLLSKTILRKIESDTDNIMASSFLFLVKEWIRELLNDIKYLFDEYTVKFLENTKS